MLLKEFRLTELLGGDDWQHVRVRRGALLWLPGARFAFTNEPEQFVIALKWGRQIRIDLRKLQLVPPDESQAEQPGARAEIPPEILALLEALAPPAPASAPAGAGEAAADVADSRADAAAETGPFNTDEPSASDALADVAGESAEAGVPVPLPNPADPVDYVTWLNELTVTDGPSAAPLLQAAIDKVVPFEGDENLYRAALDGDPVALNSPEIVAWLETNQAAIRQFRDATQYEHRGFPMHSEGGDLIGILLPHLGQMRNLARATVMEARRAELEGRPADAMDRYLDTFVSGAQVSSGPTIIESLVGSAIQALSADALLDSFAGPVADQIDYVRLAERIVDSYPPLRPAAETFQVERAFMMDVLQRMYTFDPETRTYSVGQKGIEYYNSFAVSDGVESEPLNPAFIDELNALGYERALQQANRHYDAMTEAFQAPYQEGAQVMRALDKSVSSGETSRNPLMRVMMPALSRYYALHTRAETNRRATVLTANIMAYRQQHGDYPGSLDTFGDREFVVDPFTDQQFVYRREGAGFVLYSVGPNGGDDGGVHDRRTRDNDLRYWPRPRDK